MGGVKHGKANDVGLIVHDVIQPQQGKILKKEDGEGEGGEETSDF